MTALKPLIVIGLMYPFVVAPLHAVTTKSDTSKREALKKDAEGEFAGLNFGVGISLTTDREGGPEVERAELANGIVRVTEEQEEIPRVILETHYFFISKRSLLRGVEVGKWGWGPFLGIQPGEDDIIRALAAGLMLGLRKDDDAKNTWNFGVGWIFDSDVQRLGDGFVENQPPPDGETAIRFRKDSDQGVVLMWSFGWGGGTE